ncbi:hypothetical protein ACLB2K_069067 [Fragaria x ananassa]
MEAEKSGASLDSLIAGFNIRISELQELVIARNMYPASSVTDLSAVDAAVKAMEVQKLINASLKKQRILKDMSICAPAHVPERMSMLNLDTNRCLFPESSQQNAGSGISKLEEDPAPPPKSSYANLAKRYNTALHRGGTFCFAEETDFESLKTQIYMRGRLTLEKVNAAINDMATYAEANYQLIAAPKKNVAGDRWEKALEIRDIAMHDAVKGKHFFLETDMKGPSLKLDNTGKAILTVLRHLGRVSETRIGHHRVIILLKPH